jgi:TRAP-type mannitol/chloroaromatic compound transport system permease large subunit
VIQGFAKGIGLLATTAYYTVSNYGFVALPMFIMMGEFAFQGEIGSLLYTAVSKWLGHRYGGLAMATTVANAMFATIAGDSLSATATFGKIAIPEMIQYKYDKVFACGVVLTGEDSDPLLYFYQCVSRQAHDGWIYPRNHIHHNLHELYIH